MVQGLATGLRSTVLNLALVCPVDRDPTQTPRVNHLHHPSAHRGPEQPRLTAEARVGADQG